MKRYRKKPVIVEAEQWTDWEKPPLDVFRSSLPECHGMGYFAVSVFRGLDLSVGDWIVKIADGQYRRCTAEEFAATYEPVE